jgi:hypothetical protein
VWDKAQMVAFLQSGRNGHSGVVGEMTLVVEEPLQYMTDADVTAVAKYLRHEATAQRDLTHALLSLRCQGLVQYHEPQHQLLDLGTVKGKRNHWHLLFIKCQ